MSIDDEGEYLPYEEHKRPDFSDYNTDSFASASEAEAFYDWLQENWHPNEGGYSADDVYERVTGEVIIHYNEDGEIDFIEYEFEGSP